MTSISPEYQAALDYLYSFVDFSLKHSTTYTSAQFDLGRMRQLMAALGNPERAYPIIHVAGTKGKGSVSALCANVLQAASYRVGLYTSPHLEDYTERIQVNGENIPHRELVALVEEIKPVVAGIPQLSTFEITTALGYLYFARQKVDAAVIEVGLGGRLDATNICQPLVSVITSLSYDHMFLLGDTLAKIAAEKAGIIKEGIPVVLAPQADEARQVVEKIAQERSAPLYQVGQDVHFDLIAHNLQGQSFQLRLASGHRLPSIHLESPMELWIPLLGAHQVENAVTAFTALHVARQAGLDSPGMQIDPQAIQQGFRQVKWPARFELLRLDPPLVLDSAHNYDSALKLRRALDDYLPGLPLVLVFGASEDKDAHGMFRELLPRAAHLILVKSFHPRAADPHGLAELARPYGLPIQIIPDVADALGEALRLAGKEAGVLVAGSLFVAAGARIAWHDIWCEKVG